MSPYRRKGSKAWMVTVISRELAHIRRSSGTHDRETADAIQAMLVALSRRGKRDWDLIDAVLDDRITIGTLYDYYLANDLDTLRTKLADVDLAPAIDAWVARIRKELAAETARKYVQYIERIFPYAVKRANGSRAPQGARLPAYASTVTRKWLKDELAKVPGSNTNRRRVGQAWALVLDDLVEAELLKANPMREIALPASNKSTTPHILITDAQRLIGLMPAGPHRALAAFRHGAGVEMQAAEVLRRRDIVDETNRVMWAHGRKNSRRDRQVIVEPWAFEIIMAYVRSAHLMPDAPLWGGVSRKAHAAAQDEAVAVLRTQGVDVPAKYTLHAACHTYCVDAFKRGVDPVLVANNRGHATTALVQTLYGRFRPALTDLIRADQRSRAGGK